MLLFVTQLRLVHSSSFPLKIEGLPKFCSSSSAVANVVLHGEDRDVPHEGHVPRESQHLYRSATMHKHVMSAARGM